MNPRAYLCFILHAHLPYVRHPEHPDFLEEHWLFEALTECYVPLLMVFDGLMRDGIDFRASMSVTPTLTAMLQDDLLRSRYRVYLARLIDLAEREAVRQRFDARLRPVAEFYRERFRAVRSHFEDVLSGDVTKGFRRLEEAGRVELLASAATHAVLPLLRQSPASVEAQVKLGVESHRRAFGSDPAGFWLPECGYFPGLDDVLARHGIRYFILESHGILRGSSVSRHGVHAPVVCPSGVAAFARDPECSRQVWSAEEGYPGHPDYRDFYRDIGFDLPLEYVSRSIGPDELRIATGIKYQRITNRARSRKEPYDRIRAVEQAALHAEHFLSARGEQIGRIEGGMDRRPIVVAPYDAELFGHWWFEGPEWLDATLRRAASGSDGLAAVTPSEYLAEYPEGQLSVPSMSSWGRGGYFETWVNDKTEWMLRPLQRAAETMEGLAARCEGGPDSHGRRRRILAQAARELLLAQSSDWPFILRSGTATGYAARRVREHLQRFDELASWADRADSNEDEDRRLAEWESRTAIFPGLAPEVFHLRGGPRIWARLREPRRVAFIGAEAVPFVKVGGLADVMGALPPALGAAGIETLVIIPAYGPVDRARHGLRTIREGLEAPLGGRRERFNLLEAASSAPHVRCLFVEHPGYFGRDGIYGDPKSGAEYSDGAERFIFFTRAALEALKALEEPIDIVHCHDHQTALGPAYLKLLLRRDPVLGRAASVLTIHNLGYQGICSSAAFLLSGFGEESLHPASPFLHRGQVNVLRAGIAFATRVSTVSPTYAREICTSPEQGAGLERVLAARGSDLSGILNGIDAREWDPSADAHLPRRYSVERREGKRDCKEALRRRVGLDPKRIDSPLAGMITRLVDQKGLDLLCAELDRLLALGLDLVVLGTGLPKYHEFLEEEARKIPGRVAAELKFDNALAHQIEAGADLFLMPSLYEPCGLNQMYSLRYGAVPVVRATGGLADTVVDADADPAAGNGFTFAEYRPEAFLDAVRRAVSAFGDRERWGRIVHAGMAADNSWGSSAGRYIDLYRDALEARDRE